MHRYLPKQYYKDICSVSYDKLKQNGITCLLFDLDNTLATMEETMPNQKVKDLFEMLKKDFQIVIVSNSFKKRVLPFATILGVDYIAFAKKPFGFSIRKIMKKYNVTPAQIAIIGDQFMTDMALGNKKGIWTIFVDALGLKDLKVTSFNRKLENKIMKKYQQQQLFERGDYYE